ncbi:hypothetical protein GCM10027347_44900 [Larkinella harenae]
MPKIKITFPAIHFDSIEMEVTDEQWEDIHYQWNPEEKAKFIEEQNQKRIDPEMTWEKLILDAFDVGYASIKKVKA